MNWFLVSFFAQFILGTSAVFDKLLLKKSYPNPVGYAFWVGVLGFVSVLLLPFGFGAVSLETVGLALWGGCVFLWALLFLYKALHAQEASSVVMAIGGLSPPATLLFSWLLTGHRLGAYELFGFFLLVGGSIILAGTAERSLRFRVGIIIGISALLFGYSNVLTKQVFSDTSFVAGFFLLKAGGVLAALSLLLYSPWRLAILSRKKQDKFHNKAGYLCNRAYAGIGSLLLFYAFSLGIPPLVDAMQSARFLFLILGGWLLLGERFSGRILFLKVAAFVVIALGIIVLGVGDYLQRTAPDPARPIQWGVTFSQKFSSEFDFGSLGAPGAKLTWVDNYNAIVDDLGVRHLRLIAYWDLLEPADDVFDFSGLDYQMRRAEEAGADVILVIGKKVPRWPECHEPAWAQNLESRMKNQELFDFVSEVIDRYKDSSALRYWQVENEPFLPFGEGECALSGRELLETEIVLVKKLDPNTPVLITDSGEIGPWIRAAHRGNVFGTTMYRRVHHDTLGNFEYPLGPAFFRVKEKITRFLIQDYEKKFVVIELGMEPWLKRQLYETTPEEQFAVFDFAFFQNSIEYAKATGFDEYYLWGAEWWYWLKVRHGDERFWDEAQKLF